jgi:hypothetical protein
MYIKNRELEIEIISKILVKLILIREEKRI